MIKATQTHKHDDDGAPQRVWQQQQPSVAANLLTPNTNQQKQKYSQARSIQEVSQQRRMSALRGHSCSICSATAIREQKVMLLMKPCVPTTSSGGAARLWLTRGPSTLR
jgi:hypothetical protein